MIGRPLRGVGVRRCWYFVAAGVAGLLVAVVPKLIDALLIDYGIYHGGGFVALALLGLWRGVVLTCGLLIGAVVLWRWWRRSSGVTRAAVPAVDSAPRPPVDCSRGTTDRG